MKTIFRTAAFAALLIASSCGKDSVDASIEQEQQAELLEQTPLEANIVSDNVLIEGATKENGMPPTPNEAIQFDASETSKMALLSEGFEVSLSSDAAIVGAYLQFKSNDGVAADSYYDINVEENEGDDAWGKSSKFSAKKRALSAKVEETTNLDIDFSTAIAPGTFCYDICVYDADGNISAPQEICVTVESWGGNSAIIANWDLTKEVETYLGSAVTEIVGEANCGEETQYDCDQGGQFMASYSCYLTDFATLVFNSDGTYEYNSKETDTILKTDESKASCEALYREELETYTSKGNWAYNQDEKNLVLVEYEYSEEYNGEVTNETFEPGSGELLYDGAVELEGNTLLIKADDTNDLQYYLYFEK